MCVHAHMNMSLCMIMYVCLAMYIHVCVCECMCVIMYVCLSICVYVCLHECVGQYQVSSSFSNLYFEIESLTEPEVCYLVRLTVQETPGTLLPPPTFTILVTGL